MSEMFQSEIQRLIPHRYPFLLVDRVTDFIPGRSIAGIKTITANEAGTFGCSPGEPMVPTTLLIEMVTQLGAILVLERPNTRDKIAVILQIPSARMLKLVRVGDTLELAAEVLKLKESLGELAGRASVGGELVAEGQMRFAITDAKAVFSQHP
ncbi:MAG: 3-hydroxyacyl-[acyl-carrier-protein] dehydratase FabZ [Acidobacteria bacterium]|nr:MAG: 3-hydroxyacyl-[acyl-carrier-protein] dehydratase FabZ [Acidobacteriota bacterium]